MNGKGSVPRPIQDKEHFDKEFERIFYSVPIKYVNMEELEKLYPMKGANETISIPEHKATLNSTNEGIGSTGTKSDKSG